MTNVAFGPTITVSNSYTDGYVKTTSMGTIAARRVAANGRGPQIITHVYGYVSGKGATRSITMYLGSASATFNRAAATTGVGTGYVNTSDWYISNGDSSVEFGYSSSGSFYYARGGTGTRVTPYGSYTGALRCAYTYIQSPAAPITVTSITGGDGVAKVSWVAGDNGGSAITGYNVEYSINSSFTSSKTISTVGGETSISIAELDSGSTYYFRVYAKNAVTAAAATTSVASAAASLLIPIYGALTYNDPTVYTASYGSFWSLAGHVTGFDGAGEIVDPVVAKETYSYFSTTDNKFAKTNVDVRINAPSANRFTNAYGKIFAEGITGDEVIIGTIGTYFEGTTDLVKGPNGSVNRIAFKTVLGYSDLDNPNPTVLSWTARSGNDLYNQEFILTMDGYFEDPYARIEVKVGKGDGTTQNFIQEIPLSAASPNYYEELAVFLFYSCTALGYGQLVLKICNTDDYASAQSATINFGAYNLQQPKWNEPITIKGLCRSLYIRNGGRVDANFPDNVGFYNAPNLNIAEYEYEPSFNSLVFETSFPPVHSVKSNMWTYLQDACVATHEEIAIIDDVITVRNVGIRNVDPDDFVEPPNVAISSTLTGRQVDVNYHESEYVASGEIYSAREDDNKVLSVKVGESIKTTIQTDSSIISVNQPFPYLRMEGVTIPAGVYEIMDGTGLPISDKLWLNSGGNLVVSLNPDLAGAIDIFLTGPIKAITSDPTYSIAVSDGKNQYAALSITGSAVRGTKKVLSLLTGSAEAVTVQEVATTITNPFVTTLAQAYDVGITASTVASGPNVSLSGSVSVGNIASFGLAQGSLIRYRENIYRVTDATINNIAVSFNAVSYVVVDDLVDSWPIADSTVDGYDYVWGGYQSHDARITPLATTATREIFVFLDTDSNPYFSESTLGTISVLLDTDGVPYYSETFDTTFGKLLYLDYDVVPYYKA